MQLLKSRRARATALVATAAAIAIPATAIGNVADNTQAARNAIQGGKARNVILLIGDGMGDSEITIARNYSVGADGRLAMDRLPMTGAYTTYSVEQDDPSKVDYVPDSAATGTGWATGRKSYDGAISVLPSGKPVPTILELAKSAGYRTGNVSTAELQDATPAVLASHVVARGCKGPESMDECPQNALENGGRGSIAEQMVALEADVTLGGGAAAFDQTVQAGRYRGLTVRQQAQVSGYDIVTDTASMKAARGDKPILGIFADTNMDLEWVGPTPTVAGTAPTRCAVNPDRDAAQPHVLEMATKAINILDKQTQDSPRGFFLQIEGASIDKQDHAANPCGQIGENVAFDAAVRKSLDYQRQHPDTLVIVTADHGHTSQIVEAGSVTPGLTATLVTNEGSDMTISYGTAPAGGSQQHTGTQVRVAAGGPQAANVLGVTNQTDLFFTMKRALGVG